jgi:hypothetical protein
LLWLHFNAITITVQLIPPTGPKSEYHLCGDVHDPLKFVDCWAQLRVFFR